jgi:hypothetical protein
MCSTWNIVGESGWEWGLVRGTVSVTNWQEPETNFGSPVYYYSATTSAAAVSASALIVGTIISLYVVFGARAREYNL